MKTESEYTQLFLENAPLQNSEVAAIANHYWIDMTSHLNTYFSHESRNIITVNAAKKLKERMSDGTSAELAWKDVIRDFLSNHYWNQPEQSKRPEVKKTEDQKIFWQLFKYGRVLFLSMIVLKIAVYYFGIQGSAEPDRTSPVWVWVFFGLSLLLMGTFAYKSRNDENN